MANMADHALHGLRELLLVDPSEPIGLFAVAHSAPHAGQLSAVKPHYPREHSEAEERDALGHRREKRPFRSQLESQRRPQEFTERRQGPVQLWLAVGKHGEVIHVAKIGGEPQALLDEMIQFPEVQVGEILAGQIADGHALAGLGTRQLVADDVVQQGQQLPVLEPASAERLERFVVHGLEVSADVAHQHVAEAPRELLHAPHGCVGALAPPTREGIADQAALEDWVQNGADCVMHHAVPEVRGTNLASLGLSNDKGAVRTHPVAAGLQLLLQSQQVRFQMEDEAGDRDAVPLPAPRPMGGGQEIAVLDHSFEQVPVPLHRARCCFSQPPSIEPTSFTQRIACSQRA